MTVESDSEHQPVGFDSGLAELLDLELKHVGSERVVVGIQVDKRLHQPFGIMHGGINLVLAESAASVAAYQATPEGQHGVGVEINANHLDPVREDYLMAEATPVRLGGSIHVWEVEITREDGSKTAVSRCTLAIRETN